MKAAIKRIDHAIAVITDEGCSFLLAMLTLVILYSVVLRYVFRDPPFWSDVVSMFGNVGMILLGLSLTVRNRDSIAMQALYEKISPIFALVLDGLWNTIILAFAVIFTWYGLEAALAIPGFYWELNMLPQKYPMMVVPVSGLLLIIASLGILIQDVSKFNRLRAEARGQSAVVPEKKKAEEETGPSSNEKTD